MSSKHKPTAANAVMAWAVDSKLGRSPSYSHAKFLEGESPNYEARKIAIVSAVLAMPRHRARFNEIRRFLYGVVDQHWTLEARSRQPEGWYGFMADVYDAIEKGWNIQL